MCLELFHLTRDGYFYTYSALAQSLAALLGVLGVFTVYRLQIQRDRVSDIESEIRAFWAGLVSSEVKNSYRWSIEELIANIRKLPAESHGAWQRRTNLLETELKNEQKRREAIKAVSLFLAVIFAVVTAVSLVLIGRGESFERHIFGAWITLVVFLLTGFVLASMVGFMYFCLKDR